MSLSICFSISISLGLLSISVSVYLYLSLLPVCGCSVISQLSALATIPFLPVSMMASIPLELKAKRNLSLLSC